MSDRNQREDAGRPDMAGPWDIDRQIEESRLNTMPGYFTAERLGRSGAYARLETGFARLDRLLGGYRESVWRLHKSRWRGRQSICMFW